MVDGWISGIKWWSSEGGKSRWILKRKRKEGARQSFISFVHLPWSNSYRSRLPAFHTRSQFGPFFAIIRDSVILQSGIFFRDRMQALGLGKVCFSFPTRREVRKEIRRRGFATRCKVWSYRYHFADASVSEVRLTSHHHHSRSVSIGSILKTDTDWELGLDFRASSLLFVARWNEWW